MNNVAVRRIRIIKGGKGSGNFGHAGRPGKIGGSAPTRREAYEDFKARIDAGKWRDKKKMGSQGAQANTYYTYVKGGIHCVHKQYKGYWLGMAYNDETTYLIAEELGIENVPMTVATDKDNSFQRFATRSEVVMTMSREGFVDLADDGVEVPVEDLENMMYLDVLIGNWDRHNGNFMVNTETGRLSFIDNSSTLAHDRSEAWNSMDMTSSQGKRQAQKSITKIIRESVSYSYVARLPNEFWPSDPAPYAANIINRGNFNAFVKKARSLGVWEATISKFGNTQGNKIYERMMVRLDTMEEYVDAIEDVHGLRQ